MLVASVLNRKPNVGDTRTYQDFYQYLGDHPKLMGVMARMYQNNTANFITEALGNIFRNKKTVNKFQPIDSFSIQWDVDVEFVKKVKFTATPIGDGAGGSTVLMYFGERYYELYDTFKVDKSKQLFIVLAPPVQKDPLVWEYTVQLVDSTQRQVVDATACQVGDETRWISNNQPEASEIGYTKYQSNFETHRAWMTEHRCDIDFTSRYAMAEDKFIQIAKKGDGVSNTKMFKFPAREEALMKSFMLAKNQNLLWGKSTMDVNGKCTVQTPDGRDIMAGDGLIAQIEGYCDHSMYATGNFTINDLNRVLDAMNIKAKEETGNTYLFVVNSILWRQLQHTLEVYAHDWKPATSLMFSQQAKGYVTVGNTFAGYEHAGNKIMFKVERALSKEYEYKGYGICLDTTPDIEDNQPAIQCFTFEGGEFFQSKVLGHGGLTGSASGVVSSTVEASKLIVSGYSGIADFHPYRAYIMEEA